MPVGPQEQPVADVVRLLPLIGDDVGRFQHRLDCATGNGAPALVCFQQAVADFSGSRTAHFAAPRISLLVGELDASFEGLVTWLQLPDRIAVTFEDVLEFSNFRLG